MRTIPRKSRILAAGLIACVVVIAAAACERAGGRRNELVVSAAADLAQAFTEIAALFEKRFQTRVSLNFGSTGQLAQQIEQGAPVDLFAAANASFIDELDAKGRIVPGTKMNYGKGRLTIWTRSDNPLRLKSIAELENPEVRRIAIANPQHAPYGVAAREALESAGLWTRIQPRLVFAENIRQTLQYAETGNVDAAIVALSLSVGTDGRWFLVPEEMHSPLNQTMAIITGARNEAAARDFALLVTGEGRAIMRKYGFVLPGEEPLQ